MIGVLGGTFNPIHFGHLRPALELVDRLRLDHLRLIPCGLPPHREAPNVGAQHRLSMVEAAAMDETAFVVDDRELQREGPSYSLHTLQSLRAEFPHQTFALIIGADAFRGFDTWYQWRDIFDVAHVVVMQRPQLLAGLGSPGTRSKSDSPLSDTLQSVVADRLVDDVDTLHNVDHGCILYQNVTQLDISSTRIRTLVESGHSARYLLPESVWQIIRDNGYYR